MLKAQQVAEWNRTRWDSFSLGWKDAERFGASQIRDARTLELWRRNHALFWHLFRPWNKGTIGSFSGTSVAKPFLPRLDVKRARTRTRHLFLLSALIQGQNAPRYRSSSVSRAANADCRFLYPDNKYSFCSLSNNDSCYFKTAQMCLGEVEISFRTVLRVLTNLQKIPCLWNVPCGAENVSLNT